MVNANDIKEHLTLKNIIKLMTFFKAEPKKHSDNIIISKTVCHGGHSHKLYYYDNHKLFVCYTNCGSFDVFELIQKVLNWDFKTTFVWVKAFLKISDKDIHIYHEKVVNPVERVKQAIKEPKLKKLKAYNPKILNTYDQIGYINWIREGISLKTLNKFNIRLSIPDEQIIIPEYDQNNRLIGVRCRHLDKISLKNGQKYTPINYKGQELKYPTGQILYGLNFNKKAINHYHQIILFEAEKSVMKLDSCTSDKNVSVGLNGSNLTDQQVQLLLRLNINEVVIGLDKEFERCKTHQEYLYAEKIESEFERLSKYFKVSIMWDTNNLLNYKDSPIDDGFEKFKKLYQERMILYEN